MPSFSFVEKKLYCVTMVLLIRIVQVNFAWQFIQSKNLFGGYMVYETMCWEDTFNLGKKIGTTGKSRTGYLS